jgi:hypothetical protein
MKPWIKEKTWMEIGFTAIALVLILLFLFGLSGCMTEKNLQKHNERFPEAAAKYCSDKFPITETHKSDTLLTTDTLYQEGPWVDTTVYCDTMFITKTVTVKCPPSKIIRDTIRIRDSVRVDNPAPVTALKLENGRLKKELVQAGQKLTSTKDKLGWWKIACLITWGILGIGIAFKIGKLSLKPKL